MVAVDEKLIRLFLLGSFEVRRGESVVDNADWHRRKAAHLLQRLALERRVLKEQAIEFLWPGWDPDLGANNLYRTLYALRSTLDARLGEGAADATFSFQAGVLSLDESVWVDAEAFEQLISRAKRALPDERRALLEQALALYTGELLPDELYAEWTLAWRTRLYRRQRQARLALATLFSEGGAYDRAVELLVPLVDEEPTDEPIQRALMRNYAMAGRRDAALRQYERCVEALAAELNVPPNDQTVTLHTQIRNGELAPPALRAADTLPAVSAPLFGREKELRLIGERLDDPLCRLLTLTGPGGIGKTRLAVQTAAEKHTAFKSGVVVVSLTSVSAPDLLVPAIADALQLTFPAGRPPEAHLIAYLREKQLLLVLDNFEQLTEAAPLLPRLLAHAPGLKVLVTSREQLNLQEEWVIEIGELQYPEDAAGPDLEIYSAVQLFVHAARQLLPDFALSNRNREAVVRICRLTGGLPLAIELAAGWIRTLPVATLADEIAQSPDVLASPMRDVPARHRSLRVVFEESWQQLTPAEQAVFSRLSVFRGSFSRKAAERVGGATLPILSALVAKSKLKPTSEGRYVLHPLLRQFGQEKLSSGDREDVLDRHYRWYIDLLEAMAARLRGGHDSEALSRLEAQIDDVRAAWRRAVARRDIAAVGRGVEGLALFYQIRGRYDQAQNTLNAALMMVDDATELTGAATAQRTLVRAKLLARLGSIYFCLRRYDEAQARLEEALPVFRAAGAREDLAHAYQVLGDRAMLQGVPAEARARYQECMAIHSSSGDLSGIAWAHNRLGWALIQLGEYEEAEHHLLRSLAEFRELNHRRGMVGALSDLGLLAHRRGAYRQAQRNYREAIELSREIGYEDGVARTLCELSDANLALGQLLRAREHLSESLAIYTELGSLDRLLALYRLGQISTLLGDYGAAERRLQESLALAREAESPEGVGRTLHLLGELALAHDDAREAQVRFREALAQFQEIGDTGDPWGKVDAHRGLGRAAAALDARQTARRHLREALLIARDLPSIPHILDLLIENAVLLAREGADARALELITFALDHPAARRTTQERAQDLFAEWTAHLNSDDVAALRERVLALDLTQIVRGIIRT